MLDAFAWPQAARAFFDRPRGQDESGDIEGGPVDARTTLRILRVPIRPEAEYLFFHGSESKRIAGTSRRAFSQRPMGLYPLRPDGPPLPTPPPLPIPTPIPPKLLPLPYIPVKDRRLWWERMISTIPPRSFVKDVQTLVNSGPPATCFDVVILGDGFTEAELTDLRRARAGDRECAHDHAAIQHDGCQHQHSCGPSGIRTSQALPIVRTASAIAQDILRNEGQLQR